MKPISDRHEIHTESACEPVTTIRREAIDFIIHIAYNREEESQ